MYAKFFGLSQDPFSIAPDPRYLFMSERHREALAHLLYGLGGGGGFVLLSGEIGTGKTTVCRCFLEQIPADCNVAYIFNPKLSVPELLRSICDEFHIELPADAVTAKDFIDPLNAFLLASHAAGKNNVLIIDEAQNLSADVLEQLRLLTNLETSERKLLQIVLIGQPELRRMLARPELEQLAQRVIARFHLDALSIEETRHYVAHRLAVAGLAGASPFDNKALERVHRLSRGVPRRINLLCGRALLGAYASGKASVNRATVNKAAVEVFGTEWGNKNQSPPTSPDKLARAGSIDRSTAAVALASLVGVVVGAGLLAIFASSGDPWSFSTSRSAPASAAAALARPNAENPAFSAEPAMAASASTDASVSASGLSSTLAVSAMAAPASGTPPETSATAPAQALLSSTALNQLMGEQAVAKNAAWQLLGNAWGETLPASAPCENAATQKLACFSSQQVSLSLIRALDRPGIVTLNDGKNRPAYAVLTGLDQQNATLQLGATVFAVPLTLLAELWRGDFATLRRVPDGVSQSGAGGNARPPAAWLAGQMAKLQAPTTTAPGTPSDASPARLREQIYAFQLAQGLNPDGFAGSMTLMQLNRATGVDEPRLAGNKL